MQRVGLVGFLPDKNGGNCDLHTFGCGNALILNVMIGGVGLCLCLRMTVEHKLTCYTINSDGWGKVPPMRC